MRKKKLFFFGGGGGIKNIQTQILETLIEWTKEAWADQKTQILKGKEARVERRRRKEGYWVELVHIWQHGASQILHQLCWLVQDVGTPMSLPK
jgi:UDP-N-acetylglucosamine:LPS N-acetylglucosamine transferase